MPFVIQRKKEPDPVLTSFPEGAVSDQFKALIRQAYREDRLWVMAEPPAGETYHGPVKHGRLHQWLNALPFFTEDQLFNKSECWAFGLSIFWLNNLKLQLFYLRSELYERLWEDRWYDIFLRLREAGLSTAMLFNVTNSHEAQPGLGLVFFSEGDAVVAQALIDEIDFNSLKLPLT